MSVNPSKEVWLLCVNPSKGGVASVLVSLSEVGVAECKDRNILLQYFILSPPDCDSIHQHLQQKKASE